MTDVKGRGEAEPGGEALTARVELDLVLCKGCGIC
jgi:Pyruvate/2-oxoacid:ferredoxin oxidoreductase delta subunit